MAKLTIHFYHALNDFLPPALRETEITHGFDRKASIKDMIESFNVPHTEIESIWVNGTAVDFDYIVQNGDTIQVYPIGENSAIVSSHPLRPAVSQPPIFVVDVNLGKLARYLRLLGFDCWYRNDYKDDVIANIASEQQRTVLTRDRSLLQRKLITYGYFVRAGQPKQQTREVFYRFGLYPWIKPLTRCTHCNEALLAVDKSTIEHRLQPLTKLHYDKFLRCAGCQRIYWQGSHCAHIRALVDTFVTQQTYTQV